MVDPSLTPRRPILNPSGSAIPAEDSGKIEGVAPSFPDSVLHILRAVWKPDVARAFIYERPRAHCGAIAT